jgi:hypothetical protein
MKITWLYYLKNIPWYLFFGLVKILPWKFCVFAHRKTAMTIDHLAELKKVPYYVMMEYLEKEESK